jgi:hypothetical protein
VPGVFAFGDDAIVATDTITADAHMIVARTHPGDRIVTVVAGIAAEHVPGIFPLGDNPVVATLTTPDHCHVVYSKHVGPYRGCVADLAFTDDAYMLAGRGAGLYPTCQGMTSGALGGCANKNPLYMTGFTTHQGMFEIKRKSRIVMIKIGANFKRSGAARVKPAQHQQNHQEKTKD